MKKPTTSAHHKKANPPLKSSELPKTYLIFPYFRTSEPVWVAGVELRSSHDLRGVSNEDKKHLKTLFSMFFISDFIRQTDVSYAVLPSVGDEKERIEFAETVHRAHTFLAYFYSSSSHIEGRPIFGYECATYYWFSSGRISKDSIRTSTEPHTKRLESLWPPKLVPVYDPYFAPGYYCSVNGRELTAIVPGMQIFPPTRDLTLNVNQDIYWDLESFAHRPHNWAFLRFFDPDFQHKGDLGRRILTALSWHNRSGSGKLDEQESLLYLAIALESLLGLEQGEKVTERFKESVRLLIGPVEKLDSWLDQFYKARSSIAHDGTWHHLHYYPVERSKLNEFFKGQRTAEKHGTLTAYGRQIFRLCLHAILSGAMLSQETNLSGALVPNRERLTRLVTALKESKPALERLLSVRVLLLDLYEFWNSGDSGVELKDLFAATESVVNTYLETAPDLSGKARGQLDQLVHFDPQMSSFDRLKVIQSVYEALEWKETPFAWQYNGRRGQLLQMAEDPLCCLRTFLDYAALSQHLLRASKEAPGAKAVFSV